MRKRVHTRLSKKDRTQGHTRRNRGLSSLGHSTVLNCQRSPFYSTVLLYTYISRFPVNPHYQQQFYLRPLFIAFFNFSHKRPTFAFAGESGYTPGSAQRIAHSGPHAETGGHFGWGGITTLGAFHTFRKPCVARCQNGKLCRFWALVGCAPEERRKPSGQRCAHARRCPEASRPRWAALLCLQFGDVAVFSLCAHYFLNVQGRGGITTLGALCVLPKRRMAACQSDLFAVF